MRKKLLLISLLVSLAIPGFCQWAQDSLPSGRMLGGAVTFGDKVYFIGGETGSYPYYESNEVLVYDCIASSWDTSAHDTLSMRRCASACASGDSAIYVVGGRFWHYELSSGMTRYMEGTNRVDIFKNGAWQMDSLPDKVWGGRGLKVGSKLLFTGFVDSVNYINSEIFASKKVYVLDESTGLWSTDTLSSARTEMGFATDGTLAIFAGGVNGLGATSDVVDIYNSVTGTWTTSQLSVARGYVSGAYANGKFYFAGGVMSGVINMTSDVVDIYDGSSWTTEHLSVPRAGVMAAAVNDEVYFMGGGEFDLSLLPIPNTNGTYNAVDVYNTSTGSWTRKDFNFPDHDPFFGLIIWHLYAGYTTWGNKIFVGGGGIMGWLQGNTIIAYSKNIEIRDVTLGFGELNNSLSLDIFPNPSTGPVTLLLPEERAEISIVDLYGHELQVIRAVSHIQELHFESNGIYFVRVKTNHGTATQKIIINR